MEETKTPVEQVDTNPVDSTTQENQTKNTVAYATHNKLLSEKKSLQTKFNDVNSELERLRQESSERENKTLQEQNQYKELWEKEKEAHDGTKKDFNGLNTNLERASKLNAFEKALGSRLSHDSFYQHVDLDKMITNEAGEIEAESVKLAVDSFREIYGDSLLEKKELGKMPNGSVSQDKMAPIGFDAEIAKAKSQREFDIICKKYGKTF